QRHWQQLAQAGALVLRKFSAGLAPGAARAQLKALCRRWHGQVTRADDEVFAFQVSKPGGFWQAWLGRPPALLVQFHLARPESSASTPLEVTVQMTPVRCNDRQGAQLLEETVPPLLEDVRTYLLVSSERRLQ